MSNKSGVDLNDPSTLEFYNNLLLFRQDVSRNFLEWKDPESQLQRRLHHLADILNLQYEFSLATRLARVSRLSPASAPATFSEQINQLGPDPILGTDDFDISLLDNFDFDHLYNLNNALDPGYISEMSNALPDLNFDSFEMSTTDLDLNTHDYQSHDQHTCEGSHIATSLNEHSCRSTENRGSNADAIRNRNSEFFPMQNWGGGPNMGSEQDLLGISRNTQDFGADVQLPLNFDSERPSPSLSNPIASPTLDRPIATPTEDGARKRKPQSPLLRRTSSNAASFVSSLGSSEGGSATCSINSDSSKRHKGGFGLFRRSSIRSGSSCGSQEQVLDWSEELSCGQATTGGRRGRLDDTARAAMIAVKKVKACWRCKILRKKCSLENPCGLCPKGGRSKYWAGVPCHRGAIKDNVSPIVLCPEQQTTRQDLCDEDESATVDSATMYLQTRRKVRDDHLIELGNFASIFCKDRNTWPLNWSLYDTYQYFPVECFRDSAYSSLTKLDSGASLYPLNEYILAVVWEIHHNDASRMIFGDCVGIQKFTSLCISAASYQSKLHNDRLIAKSLLCLRHALEALRAQGAGLLKRSCHTFCRPSRCNIKCLSDLSTCIERYLDEVSRIILERDTTNNSKPWWLSMFYSSCIQSFVRKVLHWLPNYQPEGRREYLHLPIRLFLAASGKHDPLCSKNPPEFSSKGDVPNEQDLIDARRVVKFKVWGFGHIKKSGDFLKAIMEDNGAPLFRPQDISADVVGGSPDIIEAMDELPSTEHDASSHDDRKKWSDLDMFAEYFSNQMCGFKDVDE